MSTAEQAVVHILKRVKEDPRLAHLIGPGSETFELLMVAGASIADHDIDPYREMFLAGLEIQPVPGIGSHGAVLDPEVLARITEYDKHVHDLDDQDDLNMLANHFIRRGLDVAEAERDTITEELF